MIGVKMTKIDSSLRPFWDLLKKGSLQGFPAEKDLGSIYRSYGTRHDASIWKSPLTVSKSFYCQATAMRHCNLGLHLASHYSSGQAALDSSKP